MKKTAAIILLLIHVFNLAGYHGLFAFMQQAASSRIITKLDKGDYSDKELIEIKIAYPLLYASNWQDYKRIDGEIEIDGVHYNYVKQKLSNDTLYLMCIPNREKTQITLAKTDYLNTINELANSSPEKKSQLPDNSKQKIFGSEYNQLLTHYELISAYTDHTEKYFDINSVVLDGFSHTPHRPPAIS